ncbi:hypothetical protein [Nevskia ramosa]|uniref:hypothetical protein n=1 Tax=Nevskia ramosa TaxID=64002 RepID=UPI003D0A3CDE
MRSWFDAHEVGREEMVDTVRFWRRSLKALHEIAALGLGGGLAACLVINLASPGASPANFVAARVAFDAIAHYVLFPSLAAVLVTGLLSIAATRAFHDAGWAWVKALLGLSVFEGTLLTVGASRKQPELAAAAADPSLLASMLHSERNTLLLLIGICVANIVLAVWRPKLMIKIR